MSCYVTFFYGDITENSPARKDPKFDIEKCPMIFCVNQRSEIGGCFDVFQYDTPTLVTKEHVNRIKEKLSKYQKNVINKNIAAVTEIKDAILKNLPSQDYEEAVARIHDLNAELDELNDDLHWCIRRLGSLDVVENALDENAPVTAVVG